MFVRKSELSKFEIETNCISEYTLMHKLFDNLVYAGDVVEFVFNNCMDYERYDMLNVKKLIKDHYSSLDDISCFSCDVDELKEEYNISSLSDLLSLDDDVLDDIVDVWELKENCYVYDWDCYQYFIVDNFEWLEYDDLFKKVPFDCYYVEDLDLHIIGMNDLGMNRKGVYGLSLDDPCINLIED